MLTLRLQTTHSSLTATQTNIAHLVRLSFTDLARTTYLMSRTTLITQRARQIMFEGDLRHHIFQLSYVYFSLIRNTVKVFQQCFPPVMMSACVKWAKERYVQFQGSYPNFDCTLRRSNRFRKYLYPLSAPGTCLIIHSSSVIGNADQMLLGWMNLMRSWLGN